LEKVAGSELLIMEPSRYQSYDPARVWERRVRETSLKWLNAFADDYVLHIEVKGKKAVGQPALEMAKKTCPRRRPAGYS
jgi:hypothetical protein